MSQFSVNHVFTIKRKNAKESLEKGLFGETQLYS